jgi:hypothetical protein
MSHTQTVNSFCLEILLSGILVEMTSFVDFGIVAGKKEVPGSPFQA